MTIATVLWAQQAKYFPRYRDTEMEAYWKHRSHAWHTSSPSYLCSARQHSFPFLKFCYVSRVRQSARNGVEPSMNLSYLLDTSNLALPSLYAHLKYNTCHLAVSFPISPTWIVNICQSSGSPLFRNCFPSTLIGLAGHLQLFFSYHGPWYTHSEGSPTQYTGIHHSQHKSFAIVSAFREKNLLLCSWFHDPYNNIGYHVSWRERICIHLYGSLTMC